MTPVRRKARRTDDEQAWALLEGADEVTLATVDAEGQPLVRVLNGVRLGEWIVFHGARKGEKVAALGQPAVVSAYQTVTDVPSYFSGSELACPATTFYESAQAQGRLEQWTDPEDKARALQALMQKLQPEGRYLSLQQHFTRYEKELRGLLVFGVRVERVVGKANIGRDRPLARVHQVLAGLYERGRQHDLPAIERIVSSSGHERPAWLRHGDGDSVWDLVVHPSSRDVAAHSAMLADAYWHEGSDEARRARAISRSAAWVGARDDSGRLVAAARAIGDGSWSALILDVIVARECRGRGLGSALMRLLLSHPAVRHCSYQRLGTKDATEFYARFGFRPADQWPRRFEAVALVRQQDGA